MKLLTLSLSIGEPHDAPPHQALLDTITRLQTDLTATAERERAAQSALKDARRDLQSNSESIDILNHQVRTLTAELVEQARQIEAAHAVFVEHGHAKIAGEELADTIAAICESVHSTVEEMAPDAAEQALNDIAATCGCSEWEYPGQVVRDVQQLQRERDAARQALDDLIDARGLIRQALGLDEGDKTPLHEAVQALRQNVERAAPQGPVPTVDPSPELPPKRKSPKKSVEEAKHERIRRIVEQVVAAAGTAGHCTVAAADLAKSCGLDGRTVGQLIAYGRVTAEPEIESVTRSEKPRRYTFTLSGAPATTNEESAADPELAALLEPIPGNRWATRNRLEMIECDCAEPYRSLRVWRALAELAGDDSQVDVKSKELVDGLNARHVGRCLFYLANEGHISKANTGSGVHRVTLHAKPSLEDRGAA